MAEAYRGGYLSPEESRRIYDSLCPKLEISMATGLHRTLTKEGIRGFIKDSVEAGFRYGCASTFRGYEDIFGHNRDFSVLARNEGFQVVHIMNAWNPTGEDNILKAIVAGLEGQRKRAKGDTGQPPIVQDALFPSADKCKSMIWDEKSGLLNFFPNAKLVTYDVNVSFPSERVLIDINPGIKMSPEEFCGLAQQKCWKIVFDPQHLLVEPEVTLSLPNKPTEKAKDTWSRQFNLYSKAGLIEVVDINPNPEEENDLLEGRGRWIDVASAVRSNNGGIFEGREGLKIKYLRVEALFHPHWTAERLKDKLPHKYSAGLTNLSPYRKEAIEFWQTIGQKLMGF